MAVKRINFAEQMETRNDTLNKDALMVNCFSDTKSKKPCIMKRFGTTLYKTLPSGFGQGQFVLGENNYGIVNDTVYRFDGTPFTYPAPGIPNMPYQSILDTSLSSVVFKTISSLYVFDGASVTQVPQAGEVAGVVMLAAGTNGTPGTYLMTFTGGSGHDAYGLYTIGSGGSITSTLMISRGNGYQSSAPTVHFDNGLPSSAVTIDIASPALIHWIGHNLQVGTPVTFSTTGALPTGITAGTTYYVIADGLTVNSFEISLTNGGAAIITTGTQSGTQTATASLNAVGLVNVSAYPAATVPGIEYLDGVYYVMDASGNIWGSNINDPLTWTQLNYIVANGRAGTGIAIAMIGNYILAIKSLSVEFFYDAANPLPGSSLGAVLNQMISVGCHNAGTIAKCDDTIVMVTQSEQRGLMVQMFNGLSLTPISTPSVERELNSVEISIQNIYAYCIRIQGHMFYVLTIKKSGVTLVYDFSTKLWQDWSSVTMQAPQTALFLVSTGTGTAIATVPGHGFSDGDPVIISGANQTAYNGQFNITWISGDIFSYQIVGTPVTPATGTITATGYSEGVFPYSSYGTVVNLCTTNIAVAEDAVCSCAVAENSTNTLLVTNSGDVLQHESNGQIHFANPDAYSDVSGPIDVLIRTGILDGETTDRKHISRMEVIGDKVSSNAYIRYTDDDYNTFCGYRPVALAQPRSIVRRGGSTRRRAFDIRHTDNVPLRLESLEIDIDVGEE